MDAKDSQTEMVLVPRHPTKEMLDAAWGAALAEDAEGVWKAMIEKWIISQNRKL